VNKSGGKVNWIVNLVRDLRVILLWSLFSLKNKSCFKSAC